MHHVKFCGNLSSGSYRYNEHYKWVNMRGKYKAAGKHPCSPPSLFACSAPSCGAHMDTSPSAIAPCRNPALRLFDGAAGTRANTYAVYGRMGSRLRQV